MKTQLTIAAAVLTLAACTPKFYPPQSELNKMLPPQ